MSVNGSFKKAKIKMDFSPAAVQPKRTPVADVRHNFDRLKADPAKTGRSGSSQI